MYCFKTIINSKSVDYPEDLKFVRKTIKNDPHLKKYNNFL
jgi:hypothetical protein